MGVNNFKLKLDTLGPSACGFQSPTDAVNVKNKITVYYNLPSADTDAMDQTGNAEFIRSWCDGNTAAQTTSVPNGINWKAIDTVKDSGEQFNLSPDGVYYIHAQFMDAVGNLSEIKTSGLVRADTVAPTVSVCKIKDPDSGSESFVNNTTVKFDLTVNDTASGFQKVEISGPFTGSPKTFNYSDAAFTQSGTTYTMSNYVLTFSNSTNEAKTFLIKVYDNSGNVTEITKTITLDTNITNPTLTLRNTGDTADLVQYVNAAANTFIAKIGTNNQTDIVKYKFWGDFEQKTGTDTWSSAVTSEPSSWSTWTANATTKTVGSASLPLRLTSGDGTKYLYVKIQDSAGNEKTLATPVTRVYDNTNPVLTITADSKASTWIADGYDTNFDSVNGKSSATIAYTVTDPTAGVPTSDITFAYQKSGSSTWTTISETAALSGSFIFDASDISNTDSSNGTNASGAYTIRIVATDRAGNSNTATCIVNVEHNFTLNKLVISGGIVSEYPNYFNATSQGNMQAAVTMNTAPASGRSSTNLYLWTDNSSTNTVIPSGTTAVSWASDGATKSGISTINKDLREINTNYLHVKAVSAVGNTAHLATVFGYDIGKPSFVLTMINPTNGGVTNSTGVSFTISNGSDAQSNLAQMAITSAPAYTGGFSGWTTYAADTYTLTLTNATSGDKSMTVKVRDKAGNESDPVTVTWELDLIAPSGQYSLLTNAGTAQTNAVTAEQAFRIAINWLSDVTDSYSDISYQLYGDITGTGGANGGTAGDPNSTTGKGNSYNDSNSDWTPLTAASITTAANHYYLTKNAPGEGDSEGVTKTIYCALKDNAGNITVLSPALTIKLNQSEAKLQIVYTSHDRVSCLRNTLRKTGSGTNIVDSDVTSFGNTEGGVYTTTFANNTAASDRVDVMVFTVKSDQDIIEWKVCAYNKNSTYPSTTTDGSSQTAMTKLSDSLSNGYSGTNAANSSVRAWNVIVDALDYRNALGGDANTNVDGTHWIAVYGKNKANVWSKADAKVS